MERGAMLDVRDLSFSSILRSLNLRAGRGEYLMILGENGAGKTTFLRCLDLILTGWTGAVLFDGVSIREIPRKELARKIAYVRQSPELIPELTVRQLVETGRYPYLDPFSPFSEKERRAVDRALELTETEPFAGRQIASLSGGERQRVWLAAALAQEPELCLLDEPAAFLDYRRQAEMNGLLHRVQAETGTTLIEVTHDLNRALAVDARVAALVNGTFLYDGPVRDLLDPEMLRAVYGTELRVLTDGTTNETFVCPPRLEDVPNHF